MINVESIPVWRQEQIKLAPTIPWRLFAYTHKTFTLPLRLVVKYRKVYPLLERVILSL